LQYVHLSKNVDLNVFLLLQTQSKCFYVFTNVKLNYGMVACRFALKTNETRVLFILEN
jgi:hypothetical protein